MASNKKKWLVAKIIIVVIGIWLLLVGGFLLYLYSNHDNLKSEESQEALMEMQNLYCNCYPTDVKEKTFESNLVQAETNEEKENIEEDFIEEIERCKKLKHMAVCVASGCRWND